MNKEECALYISNVSENGGKLLREHLSNYGEILLHILAPELAVFPLVKCIENKDAEGIDRYCNCIEKMYSEGDEEVLNVVDVTILEYLSGCNDVWQEFGRHISPQFKDYINNEYLPQAERMFKINKLK
ncbi:MAG: hypothetical protein NC078_02930 [Ruminococcus sp.]|nr:hypothetical protein [Ruminococcus sp.]